MLYTLALLACPVGMAVMMLLMGRRGFGSRRTQKRPDPVPDGELAELRAEHARLAAKIEARSPRSGPGSVVRRRHPLATDEPVAPDPEHIPQVGGGKRVGDDAHA